MNADLMRDVRSEMSVFTHYMMTLKEKAERALQCSYSSFIRLSQKSKQRTIDRSLQIFSEKGFSRSDDDESWKLHVTEMASCLLLANLKTHETCRELIGSPEQQLIELLTACGRLVGKRCLLTQDFDHVLGKSC